MNPISTNVSKKFRNFYLLTLSTLGLILSVLLVLNFMISDINYTIPLIVIAFMIALISPFLFELNKTMVISDLKVDRFNNKGKLRKTYELKNVYKAYISHSFLTFSETFIVIEEKKDSYLIPLNNLDKETLFKLKRLLKNRGINIKDKKNYLDKLN